MDKHSPHSRESYVDHYIRYANLASSLDPPMTDMDLLSALTSHYETNVQQGLLCGNFKCTQDVLGYLSKVQGLTENRDSFRESTREYTSWDTNRKPQTGSRRENKPRDRGNNVNVRFMHKQTDVTRTTGAVRIALPATGTFMDAGRGEWKAITQAGLTPTRDNLTRT